MEQKEMLNELSAREESLRNDLIELERQFNIKKEQYLKIQGAIEALTVIGGSPNPEPESEAQSE
jgi:chaperonin cofactor prefoldin